MSCGNIQVLKNPDSIDVKQYPTNIQIVQGVQMVRVCSQSTVPSFQGYSFTAAVDGQAVFGPLPSSVVTIVTLAITGTMQDPAGNTPDYTRSGLNIILSEGIAAGNTVYGMIQVA